MRRTTMLALLAVAGALLLASGVVLAKNIDCTGGPCIGTKRGDNIFGLAGTDQIAGRGGADDIFGDPRGGSAGDDTIHGGGGDRIDDSSVAGTNKDIDHIFAEKGDDIVNVREADDSVDVVDCGRGRDTIFADPSDQLTACEIVNPI